jgi:phenylacetic acid degradation protein
MPCYSFQGLRPVVDPSSFVHPLASLIGDVIVGPGCYIAPFASLRGDFGRIVVEGDSSIQDSATIHTTSVNDALVGRGATVAHGAILHGCTVGENALIGMNAVVLDAAVIGDECLVAAGALVKFDAVFEARSMIAGSPAKLIRSFGAGEITWKSTPDSAYRVLAREALATLEETTPLTAPEPDRGRVKGDTLAVRLSGEGGAARRARMQDEGRN